jgi:hypothetical protein
MFTVLPQMITVRACYDCNQAKKEYDTFLAHYFAVDFRTGHHPVAQELFWGPVKRAFKRRQSPIAQIVNEQVEVRGLTTPAGIHIGPMYVANLQDDNIDTALGYIVRGFTRHHLKQTVSTDAKIEVRPLAGKTP